MSDQADERRRRIDGLVILVSAVLAGVILQTTQVLAPLDRAWLDMQVSASQRVTPSNVVLVEIDAQSIRELGSWPWPRRKHAAAIDALVQRHASRIFVDVDFSAASRPEDDARLATAVRNAQGRVVLPAFWQPTNVGSDAWILSEPLPAIRANAALASVNLSPGADGLVREIVDLAPQGVAALSPVARVMRGTAAADDTAALINYRIAPSSFRSISLSDLLLRPETVGDLSGKIVYVGATAIELGDIVPVPVHRSLPGVVVQAIAYESLGSAALHAPGAALCWSVILLCACLAAYLFTTLRWQLASLIALVMVGNTLLLTAAAHILFNQVWSVIPLLATILVGLVAKLLCGLSEQSWRAWLNGIRLKRQDALLGQIVTHSVDAIFTLDAQGYIHSANPASRRLFGLPDGDLDQQAIAQLVPEVAGLITASSDATTQTVDIEIRNAAGVLVPTEAVLGKLVIEREWITTLTLRDVSAQKNRERELRHLAIHDDLTGLRNRVYLAECLHDIGAAATDVQAWALLLVDLDGFKSVNDALGHRTGDAVLIELARRLRTQISDGATIVRLSGAEFAILLRTGAEGTELAAMTETLLLQAKEPMLVSEVPISLDVRLGIARFPQDTTDASALLQRATVALSTAKKRRSTMEFYDPVAGAGTKRRLQLLSHLRPAIANDELLLMYQPKIALATGQPTGVEALMRWDSKQFGRVSPGEFIPLAEASDLIEPLTEWALHRAMSQASAWNVAGIALSVAVNVSARHLQDARLPSRVEELLRRTNLVPANLELEITESALMSDPDHAFAILKALRQLGVCISIDDFGTGYASLAYLQRLEVDQLKIDQSFIKALDDGGGSRAIVASTIHLGHALGLKVIAEGIEHTWQHEQLRIMDCDYGQGYLYAKPLAHSELLRWLAERGSSGARSVEPQVREGAISGSSAVRQ